MKRFFKFALVALATAAVAVACQKPEQQPEKIALKGISLNKQAVELAIGAKETLTVKFDPENVTEKPTIEWSSSAPAVATVAEGEVTAVAAGEATITAKAGSFTATCKVTVKGEEQPEPGDFTSPDWANIGAITNGNHTFKFTKDDKFAYFYTERPKDDRFGELWGDGVGYVYYAFDFDGDLTTGEELLGNGKYEYIAYIYCFGGSADAPEIKITAEGGVAPSSYSIANVIARGSVDANGLKLEYAVPLSDLPQLPEKFTIYTWGNKSLSKVEYKYPYEAPAPVDNWDYTPSAEYLAEDNLWKAVDADHTINWALDGVTEPSDLAFKESTYSFTLEEASSGYWTTQFRIIPTTDLIMEPATSKTYQLTCKVFSSAGTKLWMKMHPDPTTHWPEAFETAGAEAPDQRISIAAGETKEIVIDINEANNFLSEPMKELLLFDFAPHEANNLIRIKDIVLKEVQGGDVSPEDPPVDNWDYTPSAEYLAASNLWNAVTGNESFYYYHCTSAAWNGEDTIADEAPFMTLNQSTYRLYYKEATAAQWQNQFFIFPKDGHFLPLDASKKYNLKVTLGTTAESAPAFFKIEKYNATHAKREGECFWEKGAFTLSNTEPVVLEYEFTGVDAENITLVFDFGGNPANTYIYIKDIIVEEVKEQVTLTDLSTINALAANADFELNAIVAASIKISDSNSAAIVTDGTNCFYLFFNPASNNTYEVGDLVNAKGQISIYNHLIESAKNPTVTVLEKGVAVPEIAPKEITSFDTFLSTNQPTGLYTATGKYVIDNSYTNLVIDGSTAKGSLSDNIDEKWAGKTVKVTGWFTGANKSGNICYLRVTEIEEVAAAGIKIDGDLSDWAGIEALSGNRPDGSSNSRIAEWKMSSDADNIYAYFKITKSKITNSRYFYVCFDFDKNESTGSTHDGIPGLEAYAVVYPAVAGSDPVAFVNGIDPQSTVYDNAGNFSEGVVTVYGVQDPASEDYVLFEMSIPRDKVGLAAGSALTVASSYNNYTTGKREVTL